MESIRRHPRLAIWLAQAAVFCTLLGRGIIYLWWDGPLRTLLWDEDLMSPIVASLGWDWSDWVSDLAVEEGIQLTTNILGWLLVGLAFAVPLFTKYWRLGRVLLPLATILLLGHALLSTKAHFGQLGQFVELSLQWMSPLLLYLLLWGRSFSRAVDYAFRGAIALTFVGHGLYAVGYYPVPGYFQEMMMSGFGVDRSRALLLLSVAGWLDFLASLLLLLPFRAASRWALYYIIVWGALTAFARIWSYAALVSVDSLLHQWLPETILRGVHFLIPLALLFLWQKKLPLSYSLAR